MTDRRSFLTVALASDMRDDDVEGVVAAILQLRHVAGVTRGEPVNAHEYIARSRFRNTLANQVINLIMTGKTAPDAAVQG